MSLVKKIIKKWNTPVWDPADMKSLEQPSIAPYDPLPFQRILDRDQEIIDNFMTWEPILAIPVGGKRKLYIQLPEMQFFMVIAFWSTVALTIKWLM